MSGGLAVGVELMLYGMGTVFVFLALLIVLTNTMSYVINKYFPQAKLPERPASARSPATASAESSKQLITVISAAIHRHRSRHQK